MRAGERIGGRFRLDEPVGRGGMGVVWRATDTVLERAVALRRVRLDGMDEAHPQAARQRVMREARLAARLHHPAVVVGYSGWDPALQPQLRDAVQRTRLQGATGTVVFDRFGDPVRRLVTVYERRIGRFVPARLIAVDR